MPGAPGSGGQVRGIVGAPSWVPRSGEAALTYHRGGNPGEIVSFVPVVGTELG